MTPKMFNFDWKGCEVIYGTSGEPGYEGDKDLPNGTNPVYPDIELYHVWTSPEKEHDFLYLLSDETVKEIVEAIIEEEGEKS